MEYSFPRYLLAKQTVDDRALNRLVLETLKANLPEKPVITEVGAGIGTMLPRLLRWGVLTAADYVAVDEMPENIEYASGWIRRWAVENSLKQERSAQNRWRVWDDARDLCIAFERADVFDFIKKHNPKADVLIANAFLDLLPLPDSLPGLFSLVAPNGLAWLTVNFDGLTTFEPVIDPTLDSAIEQSYHRTMDERSTGGDSRTGRHLFAWLREMGAVILAAGASDWVVHPQSGRYPADEAYFLHFILHFFEESLTGRAELDAAAFAGWLATRRAQVERGELVYIAHQMDFLAKVMATK
jgi:hypothetical protein